MATTAITIATTIPAPLTDPEGIHVLFSLPLTAAKTKITVDIAVTRVTACECQICQFNHAFYKGKTQLFRLRSSPGQDKVEIAVCCARSQFESTQTVYKENGEMLLERYKSTKQLVFKMKYNRQKGFKYDREAKKLVEVEPTCMQWYAHAGKRYCTGPSTC
ncbi:hypothetical protein HMPREF1544_07307 [Mucor circinelloides 1006PhL]|uniref:Uncharacterized protein n=1 Tax=Mucor circinelloides f. circinelloides (strain 1006PhL) TaxID=1220926 RepID=S2J709_MUCC1|nr:hypothetical protein HMPREF1544_07307 [Mucor circinelloides 1006PhL]KAG1081915.1 hypothetical protein G6F42_022763 [Rhizopus arrhizus]